jgi:hypothetical protein
MIPPGYKPDMQQERRLGSPVTRQLCRVKSEARHASLPRAQIRI